MILPLSALFAAGHALFRARGFAAREIASGGRRVLVYDKRGSGSAPPLLLLHGLGGSAASFALLASRLPSASRRVLVVDLPGHGRNRLRKGEEPAGLLEQAQAQVGKHGLAAEDLARIEQPVLILWGESDGILPASSVEWFRKHLRNGTVEIVPECGHLPQMEQRALVLARIRRFLVELD